MNQKQPIPVSREAMIAFEKSHDLPGLGEIAERRGLIRILENRGPEMIR